MHSYRLHLLPLALLLAIPAYARTPDGYTPAEETVCDIYTGSAFGLCNAYCEAMDCDDPRVHASPMACAAVARNFARVTGGDTPPCEAEEPPPEENCSVDAQDDAFDLYGPGAFSIEVLSNDTVDPAGSAVTVSADTAVLASLGIVLEDAATGTFSGVWDDEDESYAVSFAYEVCCADACDTALVTIAGS